MLEIGFGLLLICFGVQALVGGIFLWLAVKLFGESGKLVALMITYIITSIVSWIVPFGGLLGLILLIYLVKRFTSAGTGVAIAIAVIANVFAFGAVVTVVLLILGEELFFY